MWLPVEFQIEIQFRFLFLDVSITDKHSKMNHTVKKIGQGLKHVRTNLRFFALSLSFYSSFWNNFTEAELKV